MRGAIRRALNDHTHEPRYILTHWAEGYRFIGEVEEQPAFDTAIEQTSLVKITVEEEDEALPPERALTIEPAAPRAGFSKRALVVAVAGVALLLFAGAWVLYRQKTSATAPAAIRSVAVLPLENLSGDGAQEYFADGMTDALITELAKVGHLRVISRNSSVQFKGTRKRITDIAGELEVDAVITGTALRAGDKVRIATQMFRAGSEQNIWSNSYERSTGDVLALQADVARGIAGEIKVRLTGEEQAGVSPARFVRPEAQDAYLKGRFYWHQAIYFNGPMEERKPLYLKSFDYFQQAINIEPDNAQAHAGLAEAYHWLGSIGFPEYYPKSKEESLAALRLDDNNAQAHAALAWALWRDEWKFAEAEREMKRVIALNPNDNRHGYALLLSCLGRHDEALREVAIGEPLDPLNVAFKSNIGWMLIDARQYQAAEKRLRALIETNPEDDYSRQALTAALAYQGAARRSHRGTAQDNCPSKSQPQTNAILAWFYATAGQRNEALKILDKVTKSPESAAKAVRIAKTYAVLGDKEQVFVWLEKAFAAHLQEILSIRIDPAFDNLQADPRFQNLRRRIGFPP
jgi:TolB-like protein/tetratricopeptide (TPR) repeat protein